MRMKIGLIGNCHVRTYAALLRQATIDIDVEVMDFSYPAAYVEINRRQFLDRIGEMDYVICQSNSLSFTRFDDIVDAYGSGKLIKICNFCFRGTFPDICYVGGFEQRAGVGNYNSVIIFGAFLQGMSVEQCLNQFNPERFASLGFDRAWVDSMDDLRAKDVGLDFPGAGITEELVRTYPAFRTTNHPTEHFLGEYLAKILERITPAARINRARPTLDPLYFVELPIHDFVAETLRLPYRTSQHLRIMNVNYSLETVVRNNYEVFSKYDKTKLSVSSPDDLKKEIADHCPEWLMPAL